mmetsp:Transcript_41447/g.91043  ORF Transcript_41447/g.91043 Transcript_41447/m.91043 type:complete len:97 (+) Transcript_41447:670-960(+)
MHLKQIVANNTMLRTDPCDQRSDARGGVSCAARDRSAWDITLAQLQMSRAAFGATVMLCSAGSQARTHAWARLCEADDGRAGADATLRDVREGTCA